jgi:hypothetical protein
MPIYDCGEPGCDECRRAFGPDRSRAIENYKRRCEAYAEMEWATRVAEPARTTAKS